VDAAGSSWPRPGARDGPVAARVRRTAAAACRPLRRAAAVRNAWAAAPPGSVVGAEPGTTGPDPAPAPAVTEPGAAAEPRAAPATVVPADGAPGPAAAGADGTPADVVEDPVAVRRTDAAGARPTRPAGTPCAPPVPVTRWSAGSTERWTTQVDGRVPPAADP